jgi:thiosulfate/3-mercaptopyruvate sulfurtransferase
MTEQLLVTTAWLAEHLHDEHLRIVDIRGRVLPPTEPLPHYYAHRDQYDASHIPGAVFVDWTEDIVEPGSHAYDVANPTRYAAVMARLGIGDDTLVVAYDDAGGMFAARLWWSLNYYGHSLVAVLDGGWQKWLAENRPVTAEKPEIHPAIFTPKMNAQWNKNADEVLNRAESTQLVDVRTIEEFTGKASRAKRSGHIPGAVNVPRSNLLSPDGTLLAPEQLKLKFADTGIQLDAPETILYCNGGVSASYGLLALKVLGVKNASVYDGSWKDWGNDDSKPIE